MDKQVERRSLLSSLEVLSADSLTVQGGLRVDHAPSEAVKVPLKCAPSLTRHAIYSDI